MSQKTKPEIEQQIIKDYLEKIPLREIILKNNISMGAVFRILKRNNIKNKRIKSPPITKKLELKVIELYTKGLEYPEILQITKLRNHTAIRKILKENNIKLNRINPPLTNEQKKFLIKNYPHSNRKDCAKQLNLTDTQIKYWTKILNLKILPRKTKDGFKFCPKCEKEKEFNCFNKKSNHKDGLACWCRECHNIKSLIKKRQYRKIPIYKLEHNLRSRIRLVLKGNRKTDFTFKLIGCNSKFLKNYLEQQFKQGMTWDNYGKVWHVDHIIPCYTFDLSIPEEQYKCFHYSNLRPLWSTTEIARQYGDLESIGNLNRTKLEIL